MPGLSQPEARYMPARQPEASNPPPRDRAEHPYSPPARDGAEHRFSPPARDGAEDPYSPPARDEAEDPFSVLQAASEAPQVKVLS